MQTGQNSIESSLPQFGQVRWGCVFMVLTAFRKANPEFANGHASVFAVQAGVKTCTGPQFQHLLSVVERPNACKRPVQLTDYGLSAALQHTLQCTFCPARKRCMNIYSQRRFGARLVCSSSAVSIL
jgi:hypothetical protein